MKTIVFVLAISALVAPGMAAADPVKVFLFTSDIRDGVIDEQLEARQEALRDVTRALSDARYQKTVTLVSRRDYADLIVEVLSRGETASSSSSSSTRSVAGGTASASHSASETKRHLKFRLSAGTLVFDLTTEADLPWPKMAERAAEELARWAAQNEQQIRKPLTSK
jgi:hypothetical protein